MGKASRRKRERKLGLLHLNLPAGLRTMVESGLVTPHRNPDDRKIAASLFDLVEPYLESAETLHQAETIVGMGVLAWNLANTPERESEKI